MTDLTVPSHLLQPSADRPLTPAMLAVVWEIAAILDERRIPSRVEDAVWVDVPSARLRGPGARSDNVWLRECLDRLTGVKLRGSGRSRTGEPVDWIAVLVAQAEVERERVRLLLPPAAVEMLRAPATFAKIELSAAHTLSGHARTLYAALADRKRLGKPEWTWTLGELRALFGVADRSSYDRWQAFKKWVLVPAVQDVNAHGSVTVKMHLVKEGRSVVAVRFTWTWKTIDDARQTEAEAERHSDARGKEQTTADAPPLIQDEAQIWWDRLRPGQRTPAALQARSAGIHVGDDLNAPGAAAVLWCYQRSDQYRLKHGQRPLIASD